MVHLRTTIEEVRTAVDRAKSILGDCGIDVEATADQLWDWFDADLPVADTEELGDIILNPLLVIHELVEIDEMLKMGHAITKDVIVRNPDDVDRAHLAAARRELRVAKAIGATDHVKELHAAIERWCVDETVPDARRGEYRRLLEEAAEVLKELTGAGT